MFDYRRYIVNESHCSIDNHPVLTCASFLKTSDGTSSELPRHRTLCAPRRRRAFSYWSSATNSLTRKPFKAWYNKHGLQMGISCNFTTSIQNWRWSPNVYYFESSRTVNDSRTFGHCSNNLKCSNPWELQHIARSLTCTTWCAGPGTSNWEWNFNMLIAKDSLAKGVSVSICFNAG